MFDFFPPVEAVQLKGAPLVHVIAQVKFNSQTALSTQAGALRVQESLADEYPRLLAAPPRPTITLGPGNVSTQLVEQWQLTDLEGQRSLVIGQDQISIETSVYTVWPELRKRIVAGLDALADVTKPRVQERIGLRYINQIPRSDAGGFADRIASEFLGINDLPGWRDHLMAALSQTVATHDSTQLTLRYGSGAGVQGLDQDAFLIDIDMADESPKGFDQARVVETFDALNDVSLRCFMSTLATPYRATLQGEKGGA